MRMGFVRLCGRVCLMDLFDNELHSSEVGAEPIFGFRPLCHYDHCRLAHARITSMGNITHVVTSYWATFEDTHASSERLRPDWNSRTTVLPVSLAYCMYLAIWNILR